MTADAQVPLLARAREPITFTVYGEPHVNRAPQLRILPQKRGVFKGVKCPHCKGHLIPLMHPDPESRMAKEDFAKQSLPTRPRQPWTGAIRLDVVFVVRIPISFSVKMRAAAVAGAVLPITRPDRDNYLKLVQDALTGIYWDDDSRICAGDVRKIYGIEPRTEVRITQMLEGENDG